MKLTRPTTPLHSHSYVKVRTAGDSCQGAPGLQPTQCVFELLMTQQITPRPLSGWHPDKLNSSLSWTCQILSLEGGDICSRLPREESHNNRTRVWVEFGEGKTEGHEARRHLPGYNTFPQDATHLRDVPRNFLAVHRLITT